MWLGFSKECMVSLIFLKINLLSLSITFFWSQLKLWYASQKCIFMTVCDCNWTRTHNHLVHKWKLNHLAKLTSLTKWLSVRLWTKWLWVQVQFSHLHFGFHACFKQGVPWHSGNYRVWIHSEMCMWHDENIQSWQFVTICVHLNMILKNA